MQRAGITQENVRVSLAFPNLLNGSFPEKSQWLIWTHLSHQKFPILTHKRCLHPEVLNLNLPGWGSWLVRYRETSALARQKGGESQREKTRPRDAATEYHSASQIWGVTSLGKNVGTPNSRVALPSSQDVKVPVHCALQGGEAGLGMPGLDRAHLRHLSPQQVAFGHQEQRCCCPRGDGLGVWRTSRCGIAAGWRRS